jgi:hypothetical protein
MKTHIRFAVAALGLAVGAQAAQQITVYKTPSCDCCTKWMTHLEDNGYQVTGKDMADLHFVKSMSGVRPQYASCHTAVIDGYVVEGHVPADDIQRLLAERPDVIGIAVPGMPIGSPGMEQGDQRDDYAVVTLEKDGTSKVFSEHGPTHD